MWLVEVSMSTVTIGVDSDAPATARFPGATKGKKQGAFIAFESPELLFHTLTPLRWNIIRTMMAAGPLTLREVARRVERDLAAVQWDLHALLDAGVLERTGVGAIVFPYDAVHVDFALKAANPWHPRGPV
jgi:predicted transcriptional regulator